LIFVGSVVTAFSILRNDLDANFRATNPPNIVFSASRIPDSLKARLIHLQGVRDLEERPEFGALIATGPDRWLPLRVAVVGDFQRMRVATFLPDTGSLSSSPTGMLIERDGRWFFPKPPSGSLPLRLANGATVDVPFSGYVFDAGQHPSRMERVLYGYITPQTFSQWPYSPVGTRMLMIDDSRGSQFRGCANRRLVQGRRRKGDPASHWRAWRFKRSPSMAISFNSTRCSLCWRDWPWSHWPCAPF
jgi:putative ABC transport system permease protein